MRSRWETDGKPAFVNPSCCLSINNWLFWPLYISACFSLLMISAVLIAIAYNFYLSDKSEYLEFETKKIGLAEIIFAALCVLALIAFGFYWGFRPSDDLPRMNPNNPDVIYSKYSKSVSGYEDNDFEVVDLNKVYGGAVPSQVYSSNPSNQDSDADKNNSSSNTATINPNESNKMSTGS